MTELETEVAQTIRKFHREQHGFEPSSCVVFRVPGMWIVRTDGIFSTTERELVGSDDGKKIVQSARRELRTLTRRELERRISERIKAPIERSYYDLDVRANQQVEIYMVSPTHP